MAFTVAMVTGLSFAVRPMIRYFTALSTIIARNGEIGYKDTDERRCEPLIQSSQSQTLSVGQEDPQRVTLHFLCKGPADSQLSKVCLTEGFGSCSTTGTSQSLKKEQQEEDGWSGIGGARSPPAAADTSTDSPAGDSEGNFHPSFPHSYEQRHHEETTSSDTRQKPDWAPAVRSPSIHSPQVWA
ncbi:hypothetical protein JOB18_036440 [Solea senegalensis]|uniref:Uncharacterized protein n=1 Tax=Solea senegalensis TaxID=28829 RepID=A0AAV6SNQ6_SOLSE|nr:hypothetical protein JOB18_036440 [Solea senegalensis]